MKRSWLLLLPLLLVNCRTVDKNSATKDANSPKNSDLNFYEAQRIVGLKPTKNFDQFAARTGIRVTKRDNQGHAVEGEITVLSDNTKNKIVLIADFNNWGKNVQPADELKPVQGTPYYRAKIRSLKHRMEYRLLLNGKQVLDPAASMYTTPDYYAGTGRGNGPAYFNAVFWDLEHPDRYHLKNAPVDLRDKPVVIGETEVYELIRRFPRGSQTGPASRFETYKFIANSGVITELKNQGYNAVEFLPFNQSVDGERWSYRYQVFGLFAPDSRYGTPDDFARMIDAFNAAGIGVIMDAVVGHYPFKANDGVRNLGDVGIHVWKKADNRLLFGQVTSPWGTNRYDYANPYIRRFLVDSILHMMKYYGLAGIRFDNLDGIRLYDGPGGGGPEFLKQLTSELRSYRPESLLIAEMFFGENSVLKALDQGGYGINFRTHSNLFDFFKDNVQKRTEDIDMKALREAIRGPWGWKEATRCQYITNHDEAANRRNGATGAYLASLVNGGGWQYVEGKTMAYSSLAMLSGSIYLDMPQLRLLQEGSFNDNPGIDWSLRSLASQGRMYHYFRDLSTVFKGNPAFAFFNYHENIENHTDYQNKIISLARLNRATGKRTMILINLGHQEFNNYRFGTDATHGLKIVIDSNQNIYGGNDRLHQSSRGQLAVDTQGIHGKARSINVPYLGPYSVVVAEEQ